MIDCGQIIHVSEWRNVSELPSTPARQTALDEKYSKCGVYQVAEEADIDYAFLRLQKYFTSCFIYLLFVS